MNDEMRTCLYVVGALEFLQDNGYIRGLPKKMQAKGISAFDQLAASGWQPNHNDIPSAIAAIFGDTPLSPKDFEVLGVLVLGYMNGRLKEQADAGNTN